MQCFMPNGTRLALVSERTRRFTNHLPPSRYCGVVAGGVMCMLLKKIELHGVPGLLALGDGLPWCEHWRTSVAYILEGFSHLIRGLPMRCVPGRCLFGSELRHRRPRIASLYVASRQPYTTEHRRDSSRPASLAVCPPHLHHDDNARSHRGTLAHDLTRSHHLAVRLKYAGMHSDCTGHSCNARLHVQYRVAEHHVRTSRDR